MGLVKALLLVVLAVGAVGCSVAIPVHDGHPPMTLGQRSVRVAGLTSFSPAVGPDFEGVSVTNIDSDLDGIIFGASVTVGILENLDLEVQSGVSGGISGTSVGGSLKYQIMGKSFFESKKGTKNLSVKVGFASSSGFKDDPEDSGTDDTLFKGIFLEKMDATGFNIIVSYGYQVFDSFGAYVGATYVDMDFEARYREGTALGTLRENKRDVVAYGPIAGLYLTPKTKIFNVDLSYQMNAEVEYVNVPATHEDKRIWYTALAFTGGLVFHW